MYCRSEGGRGEKGPVLQLSRVSVPVLSFKARLEELQTLADCLPDSQEARKKYRMVTRAKPVSWPRVRWSPVDDSRLLVGVLKHGIGNWDSIRDDPDLNMGKKVGDPYHDTSLCVCVWLICLLRYCWKTNLGSRRHLTSSPEWNTC